MTDTAGELVASAEQGVALIKALVGTTDALVGTTDGLQAFTKLTTAITLAGPAFALIGGILSVVTAFLPDENHQQILKEFKKLNAKINLVRDDIMNLGTEMKWEFTQLHYMDKVNVLYTAIEYSVKIAENKDNVRKELYKRKLLDLCEHEVCGQALNAIVDSLVGNNRPFGIDILDRYYDFTGGNRPKLIKLSMTFMRIVSGGLMSVMAYEALEYGEIGPKILAEQYQEDLTRAVKATKAVVDRCTSNFETNMQTDLEAEMGRQSDHRELSNTLEDKFKIKYDWMHIMALVYNDIEGFDNHKFGGFFVSKLRHHNKNAIVFYRDKKYGFQNRYKMNVFTNAAKEGQLIHHKDWGRTYTTTQTKADDVFDKIDRSHGSQIWGLAVIKRYEDLEGTYSFSAASSGIVWDVGIEFTVCLLVK